MSGRVPFLPYDALRGRAQAFREQYWASEDLPINVEHIADVELRLDIVPVLDLERGFQMDGGLSKDRRTIYVDTGQYLDPKAARRYRFTIAEELGHWYLHQRLFDTADFDDSIDGYIRFQQSLASDRGLYEWQARCFAGLLLVPSQPLADQIAHQRALIVERGFEFDSDDEDHVIGMCRQIGPFFDVTQGVVKRRGYYDAGANRFIHHVRGLYFRARGAPAGFIWWARAELNHRRRAFQARTAAV